MSAGTISFNSEIECPKCHAQVPADSVFCPNCSAMIGNKPQPGSTAASGQPDAWQQNQAQQEQPAPAEQPQRSNHTRNTLIVIALLAFLGLFIVNRCFFSSDNKRETTPIEDTVDSPDQTIDIFNSTLDAHNLKVDGDKVAYAIRSFNEQGQPGDKIYGVTYLSEDQRSFYKIWTLSRNGSQWNPTLSKTKYVTQRTLVFDPDETRCAEVPMIDNIGGKTYLYFAYLNLPLNRQEGDGIVSLVYFDGNDIAAQIDYSGEIVRGTDGMPQIIARNNNAGSGLLATRLKEHASSIGYLHIPTAEEIAAEQKAKEEEERAHLLADSLAAAAAAQEQSNFENGEEQHVAVTEHDKNSPQFRSGDFEKKINSARYTVFLLKSGKVYAFDKQTDMTFEVPYGSTGATEIGFEDSEKGIVNIRTANGRVQFNLPARTRKLVN